MTETIATAQPAIIRRPQVVALTGLSATTINSLVLREEFPAPFQITGQRAVGYERAAVEQWIRDRTARIPLASSVDARAQAVAAVR